MLYINTKIRGNVGDFFAGTSMRERCWAKLGCVGGFALRACVVAQVVPHAGGLGGAWWTFFWFGILLISYWYA